MKQHWDYSRKNGQVCCGVQDEVCLDSPDLQVTDRIYCQWMLWVNEGLRVQFKASGLGILTFQGFASVFCSPLCCCYLRRLRLACVPMLHTAEGRPTNTKV